MWVRLRSNRCSKWVGGATTPTLKTSQMATGKAILETLKKHVIDQMRAEPSCGPASRGLGNVEIEQLCDLALELESQDHYLTYSLLQSLVKDDVVEQVRWPDAPRRPKYRLRKGA
jgi:hypothetical protein